MTENQKLLADYANSGSDSAFDVLVKRYIDFVYSIAVRSLRGDRDLAKDVVQKVFVDLARKAPRLSPGVMPGGWLHRHTVRVAATVMRGERRRQNRERQAVEMNALHDHSNENLAEITPLLDEAIDQLPTEDRHAILLRFFEQLDFRSLGELLGTTEEAARKRVTRSLEKLQLLLKRRGVALSITALASALAAEAVTAAPAGLALTVNSAVVASAGAGGISMSLVKLMAMTKFKIAVAAAVVAATALVPLSRQRHALGQAEEENRALKQKLDQIATIESENARLSNLLARAVSEGKAAENQSTELLRLRGEISVLRRQLSETSQLANTQTPVSTPGPTRNPGAKLSIEYQLQAEGRHWFQTQAPISVGTLVHDRSPSDIPERGSLGHVLSMSTNELHGAVALVDFGAGLTQACKLSELFAVSDTPAPDSIEGILRAEGKKWAPAQGEIGVGDLVEDILDGRHDQPDLRGSIGKVISVSAGENSVPAAMVDFGRGYVVGLNLSELSKVTPAPN